MQARRRARRYLYSKKYISSYESTTVYLPLYTLDHLTVDNFSLLHGVVRDTLTIDTPDAESITEEEEDFNDEWDDCVGENWFYYQDYYENYTSSLI